jgi:hypothetical protein
VLGLLVICKIVFAFCVIANWGYMRFSHGGHRFPVQEEEPMYFACINRFVGLIHLKLVSFCAITLRCKVFGSGVDLGPDVYEVCLNFFWGYFSENCTID